MEKISIHKFKVLPKLDIFDIYLNLSQPNIYWSKTLYPKSQLRLKQREIYLDLNYLIQVIIFLLPVLLMSASYYRVITALWASTKVAPESIPYKTLLSGMIIQRTDNQF